MRALNDLDSSSNAVWWDAGMPSPDHEGCVTVQMFLRLNCASPPQGRRNTPPHQQLIKEQMISCHVDPSILSTLQPCEWWILIARRKIQMEAVQPSRLSSYTVASLIFIDVHSFFFWQITSKSHRWGGEQRSSLRWCLCVEQTGESGSDLTPDAAGESTFGLCLAQLPPPLPPFPVVCDGKSTFLTTLNPTNELYMQHFLGCCSEGGSFWGVFGLFL